MKIENQCCLLEQAKRLNELGIEQISYLYHEYVWMTEWKISHLIDGSFPFYSAFTVAELGVMLREHRAMVIENIDNAEAIDRANHLIMMLENEILTAEEINKRLVNDEQKQPQ